MVVNGRQSDLPAIPSKLVCLSLQVACRKNAFLAMKRGRFIAGPFQMHLGQIEPAEIARACMYVCMYVCIYIHIYIYVFSLWVIFFVRV